MPLQHLCPALWVSSCVAGLHTCCTSDLFCAHLSAYPLYITFCLYLPCSRCCSHRVYALINRIQCVRMGIVHSIARLVLLLLADPYQFNEVSQSVFAQAYNIYDTLHRTAIRTLHALKQACATPNPHSTTTRPAAPPLHLQLVTSQSRSLKSYHAPRSLHTCH